VRGAVPPWSRDTGHSRRSFRFVQAARRRDGGRLAADGGYRVRYV